ncbi:MAG: hypothetical protein ACRCXB_25260 [Aeromonadaceae bacterium]
MIQQFVTKHTSPESRLNSLWGADLPVVQLSNFSLEIGSYTGRADFVAGKRCISFTHVLPSDYSQVVPVAHSIKGNLTCDSASELMFVTQVVPANATAFDNTKGFSFHPIAQSGSAGLLCFEDVISVKVPKIPAGHVLIGGVVLFQHSGIVRGLVSSSWVLSDGPVYQPNK